MGQLLHTSVSTTAATRRAIQNNQESLKALANKYSINKQTVGKWRKRIFVHHKTMGGLHLLSITIVYTGIVILALPGIVGLFSTILVVFVLGGLYNVIDDMVFWSNGIGHHWLNKPAKLIGEQELKL
jgi:hypothetical protein